MVGAAVVGRQSAPFGKILASINRRQISIYEISIAIQIAIQIKNEKQYLRDEYFGAHVAAV